MVAGETAGEKLPQLVVFPQQLQKIEQSLGGSRAQVVLEQTGVRDRLRVRHAEHVTQECARHREAVVNLLRHALAGGGEQQETMVVVQDQPARFERAQAHEQRGRRHAQLASHVGESRVAALDPDLVDRPQIVLVTGRERA